MGSNFLDEVYAENQLEIDQELAFIRMRESFRALRKQRGLTQADVAKRMGVGASRVSKIESINPLHNLTLESIIDYLEAVDGFLEVAVIPAEARSSQEVQRGYASR